MSRKYNIKKQYTKDARQNLVDQIVAFNASLDPEHRKGVQDIARKKRRKLRKKAMNHGSK